MKIPILTKISLLLFVVLVSCNIKPDADFGAFYTQINSGEAFEKYSRTGDYSDIIVDLGEGNGKVGEDKCRS